MTFRPRWTPPPKLRDREPGPPPSIKPIRRGVYARVEQDVALKVPKSEPYRDPALLEMARDRPCLLRVPGICNHRTDTTVAAHSNFLIHGKAKGRKADDHYSVHGCAACHAWLDTGPATAAAKERAFMGAHLRQVLAWRVIATDPTEPERFRKAARRALERLGATPLPEEE